MRKRSVAPFAGVPCARGSRGCVGARADRRPSPSTTGSSSTRAAARSAAFRVAILDGDRSLRVARANRQPSWSSATSASRCCGSGLPAPGRTGPRSRPSRERLVDRRARLEARRVGPSFAWHEHRLAPPPYDGPESGPCAVPRTGLVDGRPARDRGHRSFAIARPAALAVARGAVVALVAAVARRRVPTRGRAVALGARCGRGARGGARPRRVRGGRRAERAASRGSQLGPRGVVARRGVSVALVRCSGERRVPLAG